MMNFNFDFSKCVQPSSMRTTYSFSFDDGDVLSTHLYAVKDKQMTFSVWCNYETGSVTPVEKIFKLINSKEECDMLVTYNNTSYDGTFVELYSYMLKKFRFTSIDNFIDWNANNINPSAQYDYNLYLTVNFEFDKIIFVKNNKTEQRINKINEIMDEDKHPWYVIDKEVFKVNKK